MQLSDEELCARRSTQHPGRPLPTPELMRWVDGAAPDSPTTTRHLEFRRAISPATPQGYDHRVIQEVHRSPRYTSPGRAGGYQSEAKGDCCGTQATAYQQLGGDEHPEIKEECIHMHEQRHHRPPDDRDLNQAQEESYLYDEVAMVPTDDKPMDPPRSTQNISSHHDFLGLFYLMTQIMMSERQLNDQLACLEAALRAGPGTKTP